MRWISAAAAAWITAALAYLGVKLWGGLPGLDDWWFSPGDRAATAVLAAGAMVGAAWGLYDAIRREYVANRETAWALAAIGLLTLGLTSLAYLAIWGFQPRRPRFNDAFCDACLKESEPLDRPLDLTTINWVNGGRLVGAARRCPDCGSVIRTHAFFLFGFPLYSRGSFRVLTPARDCVLVRKRPFYALHLIHLALLPAGLVLAAWLIWRMG